MKVLFLTDSLALPRDKPEKVAFTNTYIQLFKKAHPDAEVQQLSIGGATISELVKASKYYKSFSPDVVVLQAGIVDCAPRALRKSEQKLLKRIPVIGKMLLKVVSSNSTRLRKLRKIAYTNLGNFHTFNLRLKELFNKSEVIAISIMPAGNEYEKRVPGITSNIISYNQVLKDCFTTVGDKASLDMLMSDFHHLNKAGHQFIFEELNRVLK
ncbi:MAG: hypothetical protein KJP21_02400 [Bacteroidia bacterium]|nr:hypothetical protein [Bacteroidia bacterium]NNJ56527.1 hypothetical protein [Bacteroidia bacterium]